MATTDAQLQSLFQERFQSMEVPVDPAIWEGISARLGHGVGGTTSSGTSSAGSVGGVTAGTWGWIAAGVIAVASIVGVSYFNSERSSAVMDQPAVVERHANNTPEKQPELNVLPIAADKADVVEETTVEVTEKPASPVLNTTPPIAQTQSTSKEKSSARTEPVQRDAEEVTREEQRPDDVEKGAETNGPDRAATEVNTTETSTAESHEETAEENNKELTQEDLPVHVPEPEDASSEEIYFSGNEMQLPNVFSPNGDGTNESYLPQVSKHEQAIIRVFSATTGSVVFSANELVAWHGRTMEGAPCAEGQYLYVIEVIDDKGRIHTARQTVHLYR